MKGMEREGYNIKYSWTISFLKAFEGYDIRAYLVNAVDITDMLIYQQKLLDANENLENKVKERTRELESSLTEVKQLQGHMINNAKIVSLGEMAGNMAHELNNPLSVINLSLRSLGKILGKIDLEDRGIKEKTNRQLGRMEDMVRRMGDIIESLKGFSKDPSNEAMDKVKIGAIFDDSVRLMEEKFVVANISLKIEVEEYLEFELYCNKVAIDQVIVNMLSNCYDAVSILDEGPKWVELKGVLAGNIFEFHFIDSGNDFLNV